jgi:hypothetical protein
MAIEWASVVVYCIECQHMWSTLVPPTWDGSPLMCEFCGEFSCEVSER